MRRVASRPPLLRGTGARPSVDLASDVAQVARRFTLGIGGTVVLRFLTGPWIYALSRGRRRDLRDAHHSGRLGRSPGAVLSPFDPSIPERQLHAGAGSLPCSRLPVAYHRLSRTPGGRRMTRDQVIQGLKFGRRSPLDAATLLPTHPLIASQATSEGSDSLLHAHFTLGIDP